VNGKDVYCKNVVDTTLDKNADDGLYLCTAHCRHFLLAAVDSRIIAIKLLVYLCPRVLQSHSSVEDKVVGS
jgi:hypothetical protein